VTDGLTSSAVDNHGHAVHYALPPACLHLSLHLPCPALPHLPHLLFSTYTCALFLPAGPSVPQRGRRGRKGLAGRNGGQRRAEEWRCVTALHYRLLVAFCALLTVLSRYHYRPGFHADIAFTGQRQAADQRHQRASITPAGRTIGPATVYVSMAVYLNTGSLRLVLYARGSLPGLSLLLPLRRWLRNKIIYIG